MVPELADNPPELVQLPATDKLPEEDRVVVALVALVKLPVMEIVGSEVEAVTKTPLVPSPMVKLPATAKEPEDRVTLGLPDVGG